MDIVVWLRSLGLGKYEAAFRENDIDETVLPSLTHETLKDLGVTSVGHRLRPYGRCGLAAEPGPRNAPQSAVAGIIFWSIKGVQGRSLWSYR